MKKIALFLFAALAVAPLSAWAAHCPVEMATIDAALEKAVNLPKETRDQVMILRTDGERLHKAGEHAKSMEVLGKAKGLLNIK